MNENIAPQKNRIAIHLNVMGAPPGYDLKSSPRENSAPPSSPFTTAPSSNVTGVMVIILFTPSSGFILLERIVLFERYSVFMRSPDIIFMASFLYTFTTYQADPRFTYCSCSVRYANGALKRLLLLRWFILYHKVSTSTSSFATGNWFAHD